MSSQPQRIPLASGALRVWAYWAQRCPQRPPARIPLSNITWLDKSAVTFWDSNEKNIHILQGQNKNMYFSIPTLLLNISTNKKIWIRIQGQKKIRVHNSSWVGTWWWEVLWPGATAAPVLLLGSLLFSPVTSSSWTTTQLAHQTSWSTTILFLFHIARIDKTLCFYKVKVKGVDPVICIAIHIYRWIRVRH